MSCSTCLASTATCVLTFCVSGTCVDSLKNLCSQILLIRLKCGNILANQNHVACHFFRAAQSLSTSRLCSLLITFSRLNFLCLQVLIKNLRFFLGGDREGTSSPASVLNCLWHLFWCTVVIALYQWHCYTQYCNFFIHNLVCV